MIEAETTQQRDARFLDALRSAENVFLYFHGNAGNRATGHRTDFYKVCNDEPTYQRMQHFYLRNRRSSNHSAQIRIS